MVRKVTEEEIAKYGPPIYRLLMMEKSGQETIKYETGKDSGFPDTGTTADVGFYFSLDDAVEAMHTNACDIRECVYDYGFILMQFQGLYQSVGVHDNARQYFAWDEEKQGFFEAEEPKLLGLLAF